MPDKAIVVPTAEREPAIGVSVFKPMLAGVRGLVYLTPEERDLVGAASGNQALPSIVAGSGSEIPSQVEPERFRRKYGIDGPFAIYVGRIDRNKGCDELFEFYQRYTKREPDPMTLVLCGNSILPIPDHPRVRHLGFVSEQDKFDGIAASSLLVMPSYYESLSIVALEAWALGTPVLANARCDVLQGPVPAQQRGAVLRDLGRVRRGALVVRPAPGPGAGRSGRTAAPTSRPTTRGRSSSGSTSGCSIGCRASPGRRAGRSTEPLPGWWARRKTELKPAEYVLESIPGGPSRRP